MPRPTDTTSRPLLLALMLCHAALAPGAARSQNVSAGRDSAAPVVNGRWLRPAETDAPAVPTWGHADGVRVGLHPLRGPRGLLRIYAPYLRHDQERVINYVAVEPIVAGQPHRGLSELEHSKLDATRGKRFWSTDDPSDAAAPRDPQRPARGAVVQENGVETLRVYVGVERFDSGAHVYVRLTFRADRPHEVGLATFTHGDSAPLAHCVLTATMGNYARLRRLHLADGRTARATQLWPDYRGDGFTPHAKFPLADLARTAGGDAFVCATPDEDRPHDATYAPGTRRHWQYTGDLAVQSWRSENPHPKLEAWVNGRYTYWASRHPIPGGVSFENFELFAPFEQGQEFWFAVERGDYTPRSSLSRGGRP